MACSACVDVLRCSQQCYNETHFFFVQPEPVALCPVTGASVSAFDALPVPLLHLHQPLLPFG